MAERRTFYHDCRSSSSLSWEREKQLLSLLALRRANLTKRNERREKEERTKRKKKNNTKKKIRERQKRVRLRGGSRIHVRFVSNDSCFRALGLIILVRAHVMPLQCCCSLRCAFLQFLGFLQFCAPKFMENREFFIKTLFLGGQFVYFWRFSMYLFPILKFCLFQGFKLVNSNGRTIWTENYTLYQMFFKVFMHRITWAKILHYNMLWLAIVWAWKPTL